MSKQAEVEKGYAIRGQIIALVAAWMQQSLPPHFVTTTLLSLDDTLTDEEVLNCLVNTPGIKPSFFEPTLFPPDGSEY